MTIEEFKSKNGHLVDGLWLPRVTSITGVISKPGLFYYYAKHRNFSSAQAALNQAAVWGTAVHTTVENLLRDNKKTIDKKLLPSLKAFNCWRDEHEVKILNRKTDIERQVSDFENCYAGTLDALLEIDGKFGILDIKTGTNIWDEYSLQLAAYLNAYNQNVTAKKRAEKRWILRLDQYQECKLCGAKKRNKLMRAKITGGDKNCFHQFGEEKGFYEFKELSDFEKDLEGFLNAKNLWEWCNDSLLNKIKDYPKNKKTLKLF